MKYTEIKKNLKSVYDEVISKDSPSLLKKNLKREETLSDLEGFILFCFEFEKNKRDKKDMDTKLVKAQIATIKSYTEELKSLLK